jgi:2-oxoglutarate ferredoxin oxidoreductase subunit alpha
MNPSATPQREAQTIAEHIVEVISDSGEGAQRCGQALGAIAARTGNGIWTTEIIPAEIQPPARSVAGRLASASASAASGSPTAATRPTSWSRSTSRCCWAA